MTFKPLIALTQRLPKACDARLDRDFSVRRGQGGVYDQASWSALTKDAQGLLVTPTDAITREVIAGLPASVKIISTFSVGYEHIDIAAASARGIVVTNTPDVLTDATADIALLLMLGAMRRGAEGDRLVRAGQWRGWTPTSLMGTHLGGKTLGIVGMGRIGAAFAKRATACGMTILYHNRRPSPEADKLSARYFAKLEDMLPHTQVLSVHCALTPETRGIVNARTLALLPKGAVIVNTARGGHVVDGDLIAALQSGHISAAGLDVFNNEPDLDPRYATLDNVFLLPHLGSATLETREAMGMLAIDNLEAVLSGKAPLSSVKPG